MKLKKHFVYICMLIPFVSDAQTDNLNTYDNAGIKWTTGLNWQQVKNKALQLNKFIFVDCYTTWCGPCKMMDKNVYVNDSVGKLFNDMFISVKVQMDKTDKDDQDIKIWYDDAEAIAKQYHVEGFPTFIFLNPWGDIVHKAAGFMPPVDFIALGRTAISPGKSYEDEYAKYDSLINDYRIGKRIYDDFPFMIQSAFKVKDTSTAFKLMRELTRHIENLPRKQRYTKQIVNFWVGLPVSFSTSSRVFNFFYHDGRVIDKVMRHKGYSREFIDRAIQNEVCIPFLEAESKGVAMRGMYLNAPHTISENEADWRKLDSIISKKFSVSYARRCVSTAKIEWYKRHNNKLAFVKQSLDHLRHYPPDFENGTTAISINEVSWNAFLFSCDRKLLVECLRWMKIIVERKPRNSDYADTYANLLYKTGQKEAGIEWQKKAVKIMPGEKAYQDVLVNMVHNNPTYFPGAKWDGINTVSWEKFRFKKGFALKTQDGQAVTDAIVTNKRSNESKISNDKGQAFIEVVVGDSVLITHQAFGSHQTIITKDPSSMYKITLK